MVERGRQRVGVVMTLVGGQEIETSLHLPGTESAAVVARIGRALLYMNDPATVVGMAEAWTNLEYAASRVLPREFNPAIAKPVDGMPEPGVVINAWRAPRVGVSIEHPPGQFSYLRLQVARVVFEIRDLAAYMSTTAVFRRSIDLLPAAFPRADIPPIRGAALQHVDAVFPPMRGRGRRVAQGGLRQGPAAVQRDLRAEGPSR